MDASKEALYPAFPEGCAEGYTGVCWGTRGRGGKALQVEEGTIHQGQSWDKLCVLGAIRAEAGGVYRAGSWS